jgi:hypothetical protein
MSGHMPDDLSVPTVIVDFLRLVGLDILCVALGTLVIAHAIPLVGPLGPAVNLIIQKSHGWLLSRLLKQTAVLSACSRWAFSAKRFTCRRTIFVRGML